jgi:hypothetical protein
MSAGFDPLQIRPGLWRWTSAHPDWHPAAVPGSTADWDREVGSILVSTDATAVFVDALVPPDADGFWAWADERAAGARRVFALTTIGFHRRSRPELVSRYGAGSSRARAALPAGVEAIPLRGAGEVAFWLADHRALVFGDRVLGAPGGGLRLCPESWLGYLAGKPTLGRLRELLRPLLELPVERVLVSHGEPVLSRGREALADAIG